MERSNSVAPGDPRDLGSQRYELLSKLLKGGDVGGYMGKFYKGVLKRKARSLKYSSYEPYSKLLASPFIAPTVVPYRIPDVSPL